MVNFDLEGMIPLLTFSLGFAVLGDYSDPAIEEAQATAFVQMLAWIQKF
jgi:hypothetical protein